MIFRAVAALAAILVAGPAASLQAQGTTRQGTQHHFEVEGSKKLLNAAKINPDSAAAIALARMPGESVTSAKIEHDKKQLAYKVSLVKPGSKTVDRVWVNANTGDVITTKHYSGVSGKIRHHHQLHELNEGKKHDSTP